MKRKIYLVSMVLCILLVFTACVKNEPTKINGVEPNSNKEKSEPAVGKKPDEAAKENKSVEEFNVFIKDLKADDVDSISTAVAKYKELATDDKNKNDEMFEAFKEFFYKVAEGFNNKGEIKLEKDTLDQNGLRMNFSESGAFLGEKPRFFFDTFGQYLSDSKKEALRIMMEETLEIGGEESGTYLLEDMALMISWNQLADRIVTWEEFMKKYPGTKDANEAKKTIEYYIWIYTASSLDNSPIFLRGSLTEDAQKSYEYFISKSPDTESGKLVKGYYEILKQNKFQLTADALDYLKKNQVDIEMLEWTIKDENS